MVLESVKVHVLDSGSLDFLQNVRHGLARVRLTLLLRCEVGFGSLGNYRIRIRRLNLSPVLYGRLEYFGSRLLIVEIFGVCLRPDRFDLWMSTLCGTRS